MEKENVAVEYMITNIPEDLKVFAKTPIQYRYGCFYIYIQIKSV